MSRRGKHRYRYSVEIGYSDNLKTKVRSRPAERRTRLTDNATRAWPRRRGITLFPNAYHFPANFRPPKAKILFPSHYAWHEHAHVRRRPRGTRIHHADAQRAAAAATCRQTSPFANRETWGNASGPFERHWREMSNATLYATRRSESRPKRSRRDRSPDQREIVGAWGYRASWLLDCRSRCRFTNVAHDLGGGDLGLGGALEQGSVVRSLKSGDIGRTKRVSGLTSTRPRARWNVTPSGTPRWTACCDAVFDPDSGGDHEVA